MEIQKRSDNFWSRNFSEKADLELCFWSAEGHSKEEVKPEQKLRDRYVCGVTKKQQTDQNSCYLGYGLGVEKEDALESDDRNMGKTVV